MNFPEKVDFKLVDQKTKEKGPGLEQYIAHAKTIIGKSRLLPTLWIRNEKQKTGSAKK